LIAILAGATAACSGGSRGGLFSGVTGSTDNQRSIIGSADQQMPPPVDSAPMAGVDRSDLPAPVAMASSEPVPSYSGTGPYKWSAAGGQVVTVQSGESLDSLAIKYGVPSNQIAIANRIHSGQIEPGKVIVIPVKVADYSQPVAPKPVAYAEPSAPVSAAPARTKATASSHKVASGDTLYSIARNYGVKPSSIVAANALASPESIRIGQTLKIPGGQAVASASPAPKQVAKAEVMSTNNPKAFGGTKILGTLPANGAQKAVATADEPVATIAVARTQDAKIPEAPAMPSVPVQRQAPSFDDATAAVDQASEPPSTNGTTFRWPVRGRIISGFGTKPNGEKNDGINLAVPEGTSVKAAEAGTVIYSGNELEGYGNLILVRHADGWVSAYAHNSNLKVKRGDQVRRGQTVATAGSSGSVNSPQVHFELRKGAKPVNPLDYLAGT
jgi:murein DD-endopeptidase MepM/ murein hydrolase activator NlpD